MGLWRSSHPPTKQSLEKVTALPPLNATHAELCHNRTSLCSQQQMQQQLGCENRGPSQMGRTRPHMSVLYSRSLSQLMGKKS